jgi:tetratricopeptide (TPR) repeat protein
MRLFSLSDGAASAQEGLREIVLSLDGGRPGEALERLKPLLSIPAPDLRARFLLAMTAWQLERFDSALALLRECHEEAPENGGIAEALASLQAQLGKLEDSLFTAKLATALGNDPSIAALVPRAYPSFDQSFLSIVDKPLLGKARSALEQGKLAHALELARQHVAIEPEHVEGRSFYAECLLRTDAANAALECLQPLEGSGFAPAQASLYARALSGVGERKAAMRWHREAVAGASNDPAIAAARIADGPFLGAEPAEIESWSRDWLARFALSPQHSRGHATGNTPVIGYLVSAFIDPEDAAAVAAVARAHDRTQATVIGFGLGSQTAEHNHALTGAFSKWRDVGLLDPATLARTLSGDGVDLLIDAGGFASAPQLQALTRFAGGLRLSWLGNPAGIRAPLYDSGLAAADYPILDPVPRAPRSPAEPLAFGADVRLAQLEPRTVALWAAVLALVPQAKLVLRARDMESSANVARLVSLFGETLAARIDLRQAASASEFYQAVDIALLPQRGGSPRAAAEALAHGIPAVAMAGEPYGAFLAGRGLGKRLVAAEGAEYCAIALALSASREARALPALQFGATALARRIEDLAIAARREQEAA